MEGGVSGLSMSDRYTCMHCEGTHDQPGFCPHCSRGELLDLARDSERELLATQRRRKRGRRYGWMSLLLLAVGLALPMSPVFPIVSPSAPGLLLGYPVFLLAVVLLPLWYGQRRLEGMDFSVGLRAAAPEPETSAETPISAEDSSAERAAPSSTEAEKPRARPQASPIHHG